MQTEEPTFEYEPEGQGEQAEEEVVALGLAVPAGHKAHCGVLGITYDPAGQVPTQFEDPGNEYKPTPHKTQLDIAVIPEATL